MARHVRVRSSLPSLISEIRDGIADDQRTPGLIRTIRRFGYAFQGEPQPDVRQPAVARRGRYVLIAAAQEVALLQGENVIGREGEGVIDIKSTSVSRRHARVLVELDGATIEDLGSKNGTYVNDREVKAPTRLANGDQVRIASVLSPSVCCRYHNRPKRSRGGAERGYVPDFWQIQRPSEPSRRVVSGSPSDVHFASLLGPGARPQFPAEAPARSNRDAPVEIVAVPPGDLPRKPSKHISVTNH